MQINKLLFQVVTSESKYHSPDEVLKSIPPPRKAVFYGYVITTIE